MSDSKFTTHKEARKARQKLKTKAYEKNLDELKSTGIAWSHHRKMPRTVIIHGPGRWVYYWPSTRKWRKKGTNETRSAKSVRSMLKDAYDDRVNFVPFGQYEGRTVYWLVENERDYAEWMLGIADADWLREALEQHLG